MTFRGARIPIRAWWTLGFALLALISLALLLGWVSNAFLTLDGWQPFLPILVFAALLAGGAWMALKRENPPTWLLACLLAAVGLRLFAASLWYTFLPAYGYDSPAEQAGYVMADAHERDRAAWELAQSDKPLLRAFQGSYRKADQYGGMLFVSALVYRTFGGEAHQPLLMAVVTAIFSSLAVLFSWALARRAWGAPAALFTAWGLALYPEAVLLGSSQMREAFTITLAAAAFYGLLRFEQHHQRAGLGWAAAGLLLSLPFSPPFALLLLILMALQLSLSEAGMWRSRIFQQASTCWLALGLGLLALLGMWLAWQNMAPAGAGDPLGAIRFWIKKSSEFQAYLSERASGWVQKIFDSTPAWLHLPLLALYGILQPFLPAALVDISGAAIWQAIAIWRSLGWTGLLALLLYAPWRAFRPGGDRLARALTLAAWIVILVAAIRSGGDAWDNPRYRAMFAALQVALGAWAWVEWRRSPDPWLRRMALGLGMLLMWFLPWYLRRYVYLAWPVTDLFKTLGLGVACTVLVWIYDMLLEPPGREGRKERINR
jgi:hypothetical protein